MLYDLKNVRRSTNILRKNNDFSSSEQSVFVEKGGGGRGSLKNCLCSFCKLLTVKLSLTLSLCHCLNRTMWVDSFDFLCLSVSLSLFVLVCFVCMTCLTVSLCNLSFLRTKICALSRVEKEVSSRYCIHQAYIRTHTHPSTKYIRIDWLYAMMLCWCEQYATKVNYQLAYKKCARINKNT